MKDNLFIEIVEGGLNYSPYFIWKILIFTTRKNEICLSKG